MFRRFSALAIGLMITLGVAAAPASAGSSYISRTTGRTASADWTQNDNTPVGTGTFGNVHLGYLSVYETSKNVGDVFVYISDFDCEPGQQPWGGHGDSEACLYIGDRIGEGSGLAFTMDRKLSSASLVGQITMSVSGPHGEPGEPAGSPRINMVWNTYGNLIKDWSTYRYSDGTSQYSDRYRSNFKMANLDGTIGAMTFAPGLSGGTLGTFSQFSKGRTP